MSSSLLLSLLRIRLRSDERRLDKRVLLGRALRDQVEQEHERVVVGNHRRCGVVVVVVEYELLHQGQCTRGVDATRRDATYRCRRT